MAIKDWLSNPEIPQKIINTTKKLGFVGGIVALLYGIILVFYGLEPWLLLPESAFREHIEAHIQNEKVYIGLFLLLTGFAVLLDHSGVRMSMLLRSVSKAEKRGHIKINSANAAREIVLSRRIGANINMFDNYFVHFIKWAQGKETIDSSCIEAVQKAWKVFGSLPPEDHGKGSRPTKQKIP